MRVAVSGSTGLIGEALVASLTGDGHTVHRLVRSRDRAVDGDIYWSVAKGEIDAAALEGVDAVVHLAGEPIASSRWSDEQKRRIRESRVQGTDLLARTLAGLSDRPSVMVSGSAIGYYADRGDELLTEASSPGADFLAGVVVEWEAAAEPARAAGIRVAHPRTGIVLDRDDGALAKMLLPFKMGVGGRIGDGRQYMSWITLEDEVRALRFLIDHDISGGVNVVAPNPVTNAEFTEALGAVLHRPTLFPVPTLALKLLYGEMGEVLVTEGQRADPSVLRDNGFTWTQTDIRGALASVLA